MENIVSDDGYKFCIESRIGGRTENQDDYGYRETPMGLLVVVCDGMGGGPSGKTASSNATREIIEYMLHTTPEQQPSEALKQAVETANKYLISMQLADNSLIGMGTTCVAVLFDSGKAYVAHVGDSRCYQLRKGKMIARTRDHSYVGELVQKKVITEEQARTSSNSNVITRAIGIRPQLEVEIDVMPYKSGDRFALMSDGIWGAFPEPELISRLSDAQEAEATTVTVADATEVVGKKKGNYDNLTLAVIDTPSKKAAKGQRSSTSSSRRLPASIIALVGVILVVGVCAYFLYPFGSETAQAAPTEETDTLDLTGDAGDTEVTENTDGATNTENAESLESQKNTIVKNNHLNINPTALLDSALMQLDSIAALGKHVNITRDNRKPMAKELYNAKDSLASVFDSYMTSAEIACDDSSIKESIASIKEKYTPLLKEKIKLDGTNLQVTKDSLDILNAIKDEIRKVIKTIKSLDVAATKETKASEP